MAPGMKVKLLPELEPPIALIVILPVELEIIMPEPAVSDETPAERQVPLIA